MWFGRWRGAEYNSFTMQFRDFAPFVQRKVREKNPRAPKGSIMTRFPERHMVRVRESTLDRRHFNKLDTFPYGPLDCLQWTNKA